MYSSVLMESIWPPEACQNGTAVTLGRVQVPPRRCLRCRPWSPPDDDYSDTEREEIVQCPAHVMREGIPYSRGQSQDRSSPSADFSPVSHKSHPRFPSILPRPDGLQR